MSKITAEQLFEAIGEVKEEYVKDISVDASDIYNRNEKQKKRRSQIIKMVSAAACLAIVVLGIRSLSKHQEPLLGTQGMETCGSSTIIGEIVGDMYYYSVPGEGIYAYCITDGIHEKIIDEEKYRVYIVNTYGIFYSLENEVYMRKHETGKTEKVFAVDAYSDMGISFDETKIMEDIFIEVYDYDRKIVYERVLDDRTGADITEQYTNVCAKEMTFDEDDRQNEAQFYTVGDRKFMLEIVYHLEEDGIWRSTELFYEWKEGQWQKLTPEGEKEEYYSYVEYVNKDMIIVEYSYYMETKKVLYSAAGEDRTLPYGIRNRQISAVVDNYLFYEADVSDGLNKPMVCDSTTGGVWELKCYEDVTCEKECAQEVLDNFYFLTTDGEYVISNTAWTTKQYLWKLNYDENGRPCALSLLTTFDK